LFYSDLAPGEQFEFNGYHFKVEHTNVAH
jgi:hypothetical protein